MWFQRFCHSQVLYFCQKKVPSKIPARTLLLGVKRGETPILTPLTPKNRSSRMNQAWDFFLVKIQYLRMTKTLEPHLLQFIPGQGHMYAIFTGLIYFFILVKFYRITNLQNNEFNLAESRFSDRSLRVTKKSTKKLGL